MSTPQYMCGNTGLIAESIIADTTAIGSFAYENRNYASPSEFRSRICATLACCAKGLLYRHYDCKCQQPMRKKLNPSNNLINNKVHRLRPLRSTSDVLPTSHKKLRRS